MLSLLGGEAVTQDSTNADHTQYVAQRCTAFEGSERVERLYLLEVVCLATIINPLTASSSASNFDTSARSASFGSPIQNEYPLWAALDHEDTEI